MKQSTSLRQEVVGLVLAVAVLLTFIPTALGTVSRPDHWTTGFIDIPAWEAALPTWLTFGSNCLLVILAIIIGTLSAVLLVRRSRARREKGGEESIDA